MRKLLVFVNIFFAFLTLSLVFKIQQISAQIPPPYVPCDEVRDPEFHSLRPYQASPCNEEPYDLALFCGNDLTIPDPLTVIKRFYAIDDWDYLFEGNPITPSNGNSTWLHCEPWCTPDLCDVTPQCAGCGDCPWVNECFDLGNGYELCWFSIDRVRNVVVDLDDAYLPIMGITQDHVRNSQIQPDPEPFNDAWKMNEYVSWYLQGTNFRAEYPYLDVSKNCISDEDRLPGICMGLGTFSWLVCGPTQGRHLEESSWCAQEEQCCVLNNAQPVEMLDREKLVSFSGPVNKLLPQEVQQRARTDEVDDANISRYGESPIFQYEGLRDEDDANELGQFRHDQFVACHTGFTLRICIPWTNVCLVNVTIGAIPKHCYPEDSAYRLAEDYHYPQGSTSWQDHERLPPMPEYFFPRSEDNLRDYLFAIREWRGDDCRYLLIPDWIPWIGGVDFYICYDNPLDANIWAELFPYIPMVSTEDRVGLVEPTAIEVQTISPDVYLTNVVLSNVVPAELFFSHMQETVELADILQRTYVYQDGDRAAPAGSVNEPLPWCDLTRVRNNPGDDLFATQMSFTVSYTANFSCIFTVPGDGRLCDLAAGDAECISRGLIRDDPPPNDCELFYDEATDGEMDCFNLYFTGTPDPGVCAFNCIPVPQESNCLGEGGWCYPADWNCNNVVDEIFECPSGETCVDPLCDPAIEVCDDEWCPPGYDCTISLCGDPIHDQETVCTMDPITCVRPFDDPWPIDEICTAPVQVTVNTLTETPLIFEIWSRLVAGPSSVFQHIAPQVRNTAPIEALLDIPAYTPVTYNAYVNGSPAPVIIGNPAIGRSGAELYFPHIGSLHEYFLKCTQTILRPDGWGLPCESGTIQDDIIVGTCPSVPDSAIANIDAGAYLSGPPYASWTYTNPVTGTTFTGFKAHYAWMADMWVAGSGCEGQNLVEDCYNYVVQQANQEGVNPGFTLTIWMNETAASNYCNSGPTTRDFGIDDSSIYMNIVAQLERFLYLPSSAGYLGCRDQCASNSICIEPMHAFLGRFAYPGLDNCGFNFYGTEYYEAIRSFTWPVVTGCNSTPTFAPLINWPTDRHCPP